MSVLSILGSKPPILEKCVFILGSKHSILGHFYDMTYRRFFFDFFLGGFPGFVEIGKVFFEMVGRKTTDKKITVNMKLLVSLEGFQTSSRF